MAQDTPHLFRSSPTPLPPSLELTISPRSPGSIEGRIVFKNQDLSTRYAHNCKLLKPISLFCKWLFYPAPLHVILFFLASCYLFLCFWLWCNYVYLLTQEALLTQKSAFLERLCSQLWAVQRLLDFVWYHSYLGHFYSFFFIDLY